MHGRYATASGPSDETTKPLEDPIMRKTEQIKNILEKSGVAVTSPEDNLFLFRYEDYSFGFYGGPDRKEQILVFEIVSWYGFDHEETARYLEAANRSNTRHPLVKTWLQDGHVRFTYEVYHTNPRFKGNDLGVILESLIRTAEDFALR